MIDWVMGLNGIAQSDDWGVIPTNLRNLRANLTTLLGFFPKAFVQENSPFAIFPEYKVQESILYKMTQMQPPGTKKPMEFADETTWTDKGFQDIDLNWDMVNAFFQSIRVISQDEQVTYLQGYIKPIYYDLLPFYDQKPTFEEFVDNMEHNGYPANTPISYAAAYLFFYMCSMQRAINIEVELTDYMDNKRVTTWKFPPNSQKHATVRVELVRLHVENKLGYVMKWKISGN